MREVSSKKWFQPLRAAVRGLCLQRPRAKSHGAQKPYWRAGLPGGLCDAPTKPFKAGQSGWGGAGHTTQGRHPGLGCPGDRLCVSRF